MGYEIKEVCTQFRSKSPVLINIQIRLNAQNIIHDQHLRFYAYVLRIRLTEAVPPSFGAKINIISNSAADAACATGFQRNPVRASPSNLYPRICIKRE